VVADPVFPGGRTVRANLIAGQIIDQLCSSLPGRVKIAGHPDGFLVSAPGRGQALCATVAEAWAAVHAAAPTAALILHQDLAVLEARYRASPEHALLHAVVATAREILTPVGHHDDMIGRRTRPAAP
jgi:hypothetical protein